MGAELIGLAVAGVGVVGTLGAAVSAQWAALRGRRIDAEIQLGQQVEQQAESVRQQKQAVHSELNAGARNYRMCLHHCVMELERGAVADVGQLEIDRGHYREVYARAQMIVPDQVLAVASEVDLCLGNTYRAVHHMIGTPDAAAVEKLHRWLDGPASEAMWLLRQVLREDLDVTGAVPDRHARVAALAATRVELFETGAGALNCRLKGDIGSQ